VDSVVLPTALEATTGRALFAPVRKLRRADLESLRLITDHQGRKVPTVGGMLLFGIDRGHYFPDGWIQAGRFGGTTKARIIDQAEIRAYPTRAVDEAIAFVHKHLLRGVDIGEVRRQERWSLPPLAIREAIINAVAHADYSQLGAPIRVSMFDDRLEIENPGLLPAGLTVEDFHRGVSNSATASSAGCSIRWVW
jgi:ATP-dependent DNA helicase RecG